MTILKKGIVGLLILYFFSFSLVMSHKPAAWGELGYKFPSAFLVIPLHAPPIVYAYIRLLPHDPWPWSSPDDTVGLSELIRTYGKKETCSGGGISIDCSSVSFHTGHGIPRAGTDFDLSEGGYTSFARNYGIPVSSGVLVKIGGYFCLYGGDSSLFGAPRCVRLFRRGGSIYWHDLGRNKALRMRFLPHQ